VRVWDIRSHDDAVPPRHLKAAGELLAMGPGGRWVLGFSKKSARVWEVIAGGAVTPTLTTVKPTQAVFSPDGKHLAILEADALRIWDMPPNQKDGRVLGPSARIQQIAFSSDGKRVVARLAGDLVRTWDADTAKEIVSGKFSGMMPWDLPVISPDGRHVVQLKSKQVAQVWDLAAGKEHGPALKHVGNVVHAAYSPDGSQLATAAADGTARVWDAKTAQPLTPPLGHGQFLQLVGFSLNGQFLMTAGSDGTARVWEARSGQPVTPLLRQTDPVVAASFSPDGDSLAAVSKGGMVRIWDLRPDSRPVADLQVLAKLLSGQRMHAASGSFVPFDAGDLGQSWPQLRARFPSEFGPH
jgi:WD40 repeat protein